MNLPQRLEKMREEFIKYWQSKYEIHPSDLSGLFDWWMLKLPSLLESCLPEEKGTGECPMDNYEHPEYDQAVGFNSCLAEIRSNIEKLKA